MSTAKDIPPSIDVLAILGLQQPPYLNTIDARFFYADPGLVQRLDLLQHLIQFGDMLLCISGPTGSGKTTLAEQFLLRGSNSWRSCQLNGAHLQQPSELLTQLANGFGLHASTAIERLKTDLIRHLQNLRHNSQLPVLLIDDAHLLPDDVLKALLELAEQPRETLKLLRISLFGEPGLALRLTAMGWHSPQQPLLHSLDLPSFDEHQTAAYLMYRLAVAGYSGESPFSLTEIRALHKAAAGLPGKLNTLADETLREHAGRMASRKVVIAPNKRRPQLLLALGLIGSALAAMYIWQVKQSPESPDASPQVATVTPELSAPEATNPTTLPPEKPLAALSPELTKSLDETLEISQEDENKDKKITLPDQASPMTSTPAEPASAAATTIPAAPTTAPQGAADAGDAPDSSAAAAPATPAAIAPIAAAPTNDAPPNAEPPSPAVAPVSAEPTPAVATKPTATPDKPAAAPIAPPAPVVDTPAKAAAAPATPTVSTKPDLLGADWLQNRPGSRYTLQLMGGRNEKSLRDFLRQNSIPEPTAIFRTEFKGADWYVLVHGDYPSFAAARAAIATLPSKVRDGKPWARSFATVHADIKKVQP